MKRNLLLLFLGLCSAIGLPARQTFAVVVDTVSLREAAAELRAYAATVEETNGWRVVIVPDRWSVPDSIRSALQRLYGDPQAPLTGTVLVGDIPIPMVRDAQYLTSAFKMDQRAPRQESSVPSDRYYDDFDLIFESEGHDEGTPYFYYSLTAASPQRLTPDIFSGRIRPTDAGGTSRYEKLRRYLRKAVAEKRAAAGIRHLLYFTGHGSLSESKVAHIDEKRGWLEHFPALANLPEAISYMDFTDAAAIKTRLMNELMREDLDIAVLHHHGDWDTQYLSATPPAETATEARRLLLADCRHRLRRSASPDSLRRVLETRYGLAPAALDGWNSADTRRTDSLEAAAQNLTLADFRAYGFAPSCRLVVFDACFNGSFHRDDCIANEYIFSPGRTVVALGGTVNLLQDKWYDRYMGLLDEGLCAGRLNQYTCYLESHVIGDPTFAFAPRGAAPGAMALLDGADGSWEPLLAHPLPDVRCMALLQLWRRGTIGSGRLLATMRTDSSPLVRLQAMTLLAEAGGDDWLEALMAGSRDGYEMVQRFAVNAIGASGHPRLVPALVRLLVAGNTSARVRFNAEQCLQYFPADSLLAELHRQFDDPGVRRVDKAAERQRLEKLFRDNATRWTEDIGRLCRGEMSERQARQYADYLRIYLPHSQMESVARFALHQESPELQRALLHALGWHANSCHAEAVRRLLLPLTADPQLAPDVRAEALRTCRRLEKPHAAASADPTPRTHL